MRALWRTCLICGTLAGLGCTRSSGTLGPNNPGPTGASTPIASPAGSNAPAAPAVGTPMASGAAAASGTGASGSGSTPVVDASTAGSAPKHDAAVATDAATDAGTKAPDACDHACLIAVLDGYLSALAARDPSRLKPSATLKYTENGVAQTIGQGLWMTASKIEPDTRVSYADVVDGQVGGQLVLDENGSTPVLYQARLKVVAHEITEIESMAVRQVGAANGFFDVNGMKPEAIWAQAIEPGKRLTRDQLKTEVSHYIDYLDGKTNSSGVHLDANCARYENGVQTASGAGFALQNWSFDVVPRFLIFDEEYGIAWGMFPFTRDPSTLVVGEAFKVMDGKIMMIRAVMANMPTDAWK